MRLSTSKILEKIFNTIYLAVDGKKGLELYKKHRPQIVITDIDMPNLKIKQYDALIFTSQNAILALDQATKEWKDIPSYVISEQSGKLVKDLKGKLKFFSRSRHGNEFAEEITPLLENKKILYIRAEQVASDIKNILKKNNIKCDEVVMYKNVPLPNTQTKNLPKNSKIIFSSPSTVKYFFKHYEWKDTYKAIVIGKTTAQSLPSDMEFLISETTSLDSCVKKALETP
jgi:uroporphyrinogen-III synthase